MTLDLGLRSNPRLSRICIIYPQDFKKWVFLFISHLIWFEWHVCVDLMIQRHGSVGFVLHLAKLEALPLLDQSFDSMLDYVMLDYGDKQFLWSYIWLQNFDLRLIAYFNLGVKSQVEIVNRYMKPSLLVIW